MDDRVGFIVRRHREKAVRDDAPQAGSLRPASAPPSREGPKRVSGTASASGRVRPEESGGSPPGANGEGGSLPDRDAARIADAVQALPHAITILDELGDVRFGNLAWRRALAVKGGGASPLGSNYLRILAAALEDPARVGPDGGLGRGIRSVLDGDLTHVREMLSLSGPSGATRHYLVDVVRLAEGGAVVTHVDATAQIEQRRAIERQVERDGLTDLLNHQGFHAQARRVLAAADRHERSLHVLMIDLDRFKSINDLYGHHAGDAVLVEVARRLAGAVREGDLAGRLGGDEFALVTEASGDAADLVARLHATVCAPVRLEEADVPLHCSIGRAGFPYDGVTLDDLLKVADARMYRTKRSGR